MRDLSLSPLPESLANALVPASAPSKAGVTKKIAMPDTAYPARVFVDAGFGFARIAVVGAQGPELIRSIRLDSAPPAGTEPGPESIAAARAAAIARELNRSMVAMPVPLDIDRVVVFGGAANIAMVNALMARLPYEIVAGDPWTGWTVHKKAAAMEEDSASFAAASGLALRMLGAPGPSMEFRRGEFRLRDPFEEVKGSLAAFGLLALVLLATWAWFLFKERKALLAELHDLQIPVAHALSEKQDDKGNPDPEYPLVPPLLLDRILAGAELPTSPIKTRSRRLRTYMSEFRASIEGTSATVPEVHSVMSDLVQLFKGFSSLDAPSAGALALPREFLVTRIDARPGRITLTGLIASPSDAANVLVGLQSALKDWVLQGGTTQLDQRTNLYTFSWTFVLPDPYALSRAEEQ
jgi:hypothetical protein